MIFVFCLSVSSVLTWLPVAIQQMTTPAAYDKISLQKNPLFSLE